MNGGEPKKSKRDEKRTTLARRTSDNPMIRFAAAAAWPVVEALVPDTLLSQGIGQLLIARRVPDVMAGSRLPISSSTFIASA